MAALSLSYIMKQVQMFAQEMQLRGNATATAATKIKTIAIKVSSIQVCIVFAAIVRFLNIP